ncbi:MAG: hypothetical protein HQK54_11615, partial [Oligoflexales bacterium]|nr:hypothetical protein [Oligoflexales bacterium]
AVNPGASVSKISGFVEVEEGFTYNMLQNLCLERYPEHVEKSAFHDKNLLLKDFLAEGYDKNGDPGTLHRMIKSALHGPDMNKVDYAGAAWNVKRANIEKSRKTIKIREAGGNEIEKEVEAIGISGLIEHRNGIMPVDKIRYHCRYEDYREVEKGDDIDMKNPFGGLASDKNKWKRTARDLSEKICHDALIEHSTPKYDD